MAARLTTLLPDLVALGDLLVPAVNADATDRVDISRSVAPSPSRLDVLSLAGPGSEDVTDALHTLSAMHPAVRRWTEQHTIVVEHTTADGDTVREERVITEWHQEPVRDDAGRPLWVPNDDSVGVIPPREWLDLWCRRLRRHFGHTVGRRTFPVRRPAGGQPPGGDRGDRARTMLGLHGYVEPIHRPDDPVAHEMGLRFGTQPRYQAAAADVRYLLTWLGAACDTYPQIGEFAAGLRSLSAELRRVLGDTADEVWLGRCPAVLVDRDDTRRHCGAGLWQDPHASQVQCPRCRSTWGPGVARLLALAREIRDVWPLDRRRRYTTAETRDTPNPPCPGCGHDMTVKWKEITAAVDKRRWWRFVGTRCPHGCADAGKGV